MKEAFDMGERLKQLRKARNLSQAQVASYLDINRATISSYENNVAVPSVDILSKLAVLYRTTTDYILGLDNRTCIVLDGLTESQQAAVTKITETILSEFKSLNLKKK